MELSVVIPTLNEAATLPVLLTQLGQQQDVGLEVIVADGGSTDGTAAIAAQAQARVVAAPRGRGAQMNAGAGQARGDYLLFLHADSELVTTHQLRDALAAVRARVALEDVRCAGHFPLRFARRAAAPAGAGLTDIFYRYLEAKTTLNRAGTINGDQGLLLPAPFFRELGGFDERLPFLEDARIAERIFARGRWQLLPGTLVTSARRFEREGAHRRYTLMSLIMGMHAAGCDAFFARAGNVYAAQSDTGVLRVGDFLALTWRVLVDAGWRDAAGILWRAGRYTRQNSWQPWFWIDVALGHDRRAPLLRFHDRWIRPVIDNPIFDALATVLVSAWFLCVLPVAFALVDGPSPIGDRKKGGKALT